MSDNGDPKHWIQNRITIISGVIIALAGSGVLGYQVKPTNGPMQVMDRTMVEDIVRDMLEYKTPAQIQEMLEHERRQMLQESQIKYNTETAESAIEQIRTHTHP